MSDFVSSDLILEQNKPIGSANVLIFIGQYGKDRVKNFLIEKIKENIKEIEFELKKKKMDKMINYFSEYYDKITENNDNKFDTSKQKRKDESDKLLFCKFVICIIHKKIFINHYGLNDIDDFIDIIHYINGNEGNSPPKDGSNIAKYKDRIIKRAGKIDKDILENKKDTLFNFAPLSDFAPV